jgi:hypothetical protein
MFLAVYPYKRAKRKAGHHLDSRFHTRSLRLTLALRHRKSPYLGAIDNLRCEGLRKPSLVFALLVYIPPLVTLPSEFTVLVFRNATTSLFLVIKLVIGCILLYKSTIYSDTGQDEYSVY